MLILLANPSSIYLINEIPLPDKTLQQHSLAPNASTLKELEDPIVREEL
jgi:hypothetical protein